MSDLRYCTACCRWLINRNSLKQHFENSLFTHPYCSVCCQNFVHENALSQYIASSGHQNASIQITDATQFHRCDCDRDFIHETALDQHLRDKHHTLSKAARLDFYCAECDREFGDHDALRKHLGSVIHKPLIEKLKCIGGCGKIFTSLSANSQHLESGACVCGLTRKKIEQNIFKKDTNRIIISSSLKKVKKSLLPGSARRPVIALSSMDGKIACVPRSGNSNSTPGSVFPKAPVSGSENSNSDAESPGPLVCKCPYCPPKSQRRFVTVGFCGLTYHQQLMHQRYITAHLPSSQQRSRAR